jgi:hypothetical protein
MEQWLAGLEMGRPCFNSWQLGFPNCMEYPSFCHPPLAHGQCRGSLPQGPSCCCSWESAIVLQTQTEQLLCLCCPYSTAQLISNRLTYFFRFCFTILSSQSWNVAKVPGRHVPCLNTNRAMVVWKQANLTLGWLSRRVNISKKHRKIFGTKLLVSLCCNVGSKSMDLRECRMKDNVWSW